MLPWWAWTRPRVPRTRCGRRSLRRRSIELLVDYVVDRLLASPSRATHGLRRRRAGAVDLAYGHRERVLPDGAPMANRYGGERVGAGRHDVRQAPLLKLGHYPRVSPLAGRP